MSKFPSFSTRISPSHHLTISPSHHLTISPSHLLIFSLLSVLLLISSSCSHNKKDKVYIAGEIEGVSGIIYLQEQKTFELQKIDSAVPDGNGKFFISPEAIETSIYSIRVAPDEQVVFIAKPGDSIRITGSLNIYPSRFQVSGNDDSKLLQSFYAYSEGNIREVDSLQLLIDMHQGEDDFYELTVSVDSLFNQIWERQRSYEKVFIREHAGNFATLLVVNYHFGVRPVLSPTTDAEDYHRVDSGLIANYTGNKHALFFHQWLREVK